MIICIFTQLIGAQDDLSRITKIAYAQIRELGMNDLIGPVSFGVENEGMPKPYSSHLAQLMDEVCVEGGKYSHIVYLYYLQEARILIGKAYKVTEKILLENKEKLRVVSEALLEKECLSFKDMEELIGPPPFGKKVPLSPEWEANRP